MKATSLDKYLLEQREAPCRDDKVDYGNYNYNFVPLHVGSSYIVGVIMDLLPPSRRRLEISNAIRRKEQR